MGVKLKFGKEEGTLGPLLRAKFHTHQGVKFHPHGGGVKFGKERGTLGPLLRAKFHPHRCNVSPLQGENPQNLSKLNNRHFALRAMLLVN